MLVLLRIIVIENPLSIANIFGTRKNTKSRKSVNRDIIRYNIIPLLEVLFSNYINFNTITKKRAHTQ